MRSSTIPSLALLAAASLGGCTEYDLIGDVGIGDVGATCSEAPIGWDEASDPTCENELEIGTFTPVVEWDKPTWSVYPSSNQIMSQPIVASLTDDNGDGLINQYDVPDVIAVTYGSENVVRAISGDDGHELWSYSDYEIQGQGGVAAGDIDHDGKIEIITLTYAGAIALENDGTLKWKVANLLSGHIYGTSDVASLSDMDHDGEVEIIAGNAIMRADGTLRGAGVYGRAGVESNNVGTCSVAVDLDRDGIQEVVTGNAVYSPDGITIWHNASLLDGYVAVGNFDADDQGEIVVTGQGNIRLLDTNGALQWQQPIPGGETGYYGGPPTVADFDGDGEAEMSVASGSRYTVFKRDGTILWQNVTQDASSGNTGSAVFDFEGDGAAEVVYADETRLWVFNGVDGSVKLSSDHHSNNTWLEYPTIADVDGDGHAEIVVANTMGPGAVQYSGLSVFGDANNSWRAGRRIWNQHAYHITNVNDDGTIPQEAAVNWDTYNSFRSGALSTSDGLSAPDLLVGESDDCQITCGTDGEMTVWAHVGNLGASDVPAGTTVQLYTKTGGVETLAGTAILEVGVPAGRWADGIAVTALGVDASTVESIVLKVVSNESECDDTNNTIEVSGPFCP